MSQGRRAWKQFIESTFVVCLLLVGMECVLPILQQQFMDWHQILFACEFGGLVILCHVGAAYVRSQERYIDRQPEPSPPIRPGLQFSQLRTWANDPTWSDTAPDMPVHKQNH